MNKILNQSMLIQRIFGKGISAIFAKLVLILCLTTNLLASDGTVDPYFQTGRGVNGGIQSVALQPNGKILIGGWFTQINGYLSNRVARLNIDGSLDTSFNIGTGANAEVRAVALQPDGKVLIAGLFTSFNGIARNRIARLNSDGSLDASFNAGEITANPSPTVMAIIVQPDGKILVGGYFNSIGGVSLKNIARLNSDGSIDSTFNSGIGANAPVLEISDQSDGKILIGGQFTSYNSNSSNRIARLNNDGSFDSSFNVGAGANNPVEAVTIQPDGKILLGGDFTSFDGTNRNRIVRINIDGSLDTSFDPGSGADFSIYEITVQPDGNILVGGLFLSFRGVPSQRLTRLQSDGALDTSFNHQNSITAQVFDIVVETDGKIVVGGWFVSPTGGVSPNRVAKLNTNGSIDSSFVVGKGYGFGGDVFSIVVQPDGKILVGGDFGGYGGLPLSGIVRLTSGGLLDTTFNTGTGASQVRAVALQPDGKVLIGGFFTTVDGISRSGIARLNSDGSVDTSFNPGTGAIHTSSPLVSAITIQNDGKILIGGEFTAVNGVQRRNLARLNSDGSVDTSFNHGELVGDFSSTVTAITLQSDGKILVGGLFNGIGGVSSGGIARLNSNGSVDSAFNPGSGANAGIQAGVHAVALQSDGKIVIGGYFTSYRGVTRNKLARINQDGSLDASFNPNIENTTINVYEILIQRDGKIVIVGNFDRINGISRNRVARLNADGSLDLSFISGTDSPVDYVYAVAQQSDNKILIGGSFSSVGGMERYKLARLLNTPKTSFADFDGDGKSDISVFRPSTGSWYLLQSSNNSFLGQSFGISTDIITPADFDGDGKTDFAVFRSETGTWYLQQSTSGFTAVQFGQNGDIPVPADYDGDGEDDIAVYRPSTGSWYRLNSSNGQFVGIGFGTAEDNPTIGDYDGDGKADIAVFRPSTGSWYRLNSSNNQFVAIQFGAAEDKPVPADFDGDGKTDIAVYRPSTGGWYRLNSSNGEFLAVGFGIAEDQPVPADYDGDGKADIAVFRPSDGNWYLLRSSSGFAAVRFGIGEDKPVPNAFIK